LINLVTPKEELLSTTTELAINLVKGPTIAIGLIKISLYQSWGEGLRAALENEARASAICVSTEDFKEAVRAFGEKRSPVFRGK
jgi:2-(1,2-epoxy-1,2-dihydrophenyl)acetyl-CoA isomerase